MGDEKRSTVKKDLVFDASVGRGYSPATEGNYFHIITGDILGGEIELVVDYGKELVKSFSNIIMPEGLQRCNLLNAQKMVGIYIPRSDIKYFELDGETYDSKKIGTPIIDALRGKKAEIVDGKLVYLKEPVKAEAPKLKPVPAYTPEPPRVFDISTKPKPVVAEEPEPVPPLREVPRKKYGKKK